MVIGPVPVPAGALVIGRTTFRLPAVGSVAVAWVEPDADGECPATHPIKAKMTSGIYHLPGGANYTRTKADRCYADAAAAEADGLRPSKV
jgi:hypothetical protein